ncbi:tenascin-like [Haemaphysalis longicornis]
MNSAEATMAVLLVFLCMHGNGFGEEALAEHQTSSVDFYEDGLLYNEKQPPPPEVTQPKGEALNEAPTLFESSAYVLPPPANVSLTALCEGSLKAIWTYSDKAVTGFNLTLCRMDSKACNTSLVKKNIRQQMFPVGLLEVEYELTIYAVGRISGVAVESPAVTANATAFPEVPLLAGLSLNGISPEELKATWKLNWTHQIHFAVCRLNHSTEHCQHYNVSGSLHEAFFSGLLPATTYNAKSRGQVTLGNRTCVGPEIDEEATTYSSHPAPVENLKYNIENVTVLAASWNAPKASVTIDGFVLLCASDHPPEIKQLELRKREPQVNVTFNLERQLSTFHCEVWAFAKTKGKRNNGTTTRFSITTDGIAAPQNVSLVKRTTTTLTYVWPINANANRSKVEVRNLNESAVKQDFPKVDCESDNEKQYICNITSLTPGCHYEVSLQNCAEYCGVKRVLYDHTQVSAPSAVRNFKPSIENFVNATFYWAKPEFPNGPIDGYLIEIYNNDTKRTQSCLAGGPAQSQTVDLKEEFTYFSGKIRAYNLNLAEHRTLLGPETTINFESLGEGPFPPHPVVSNVRDKQVFLSWERTTDPRYNITSYNVSAEELNISTTDTNLTLDHLLPWRKYIVNVSSCINTTWCGRGRTASFTTDTSAPSQPTRLSVASAGQAWIYVTWGVPEFPNGPISGYNVSVLGSNTTRSETTQNLSYNVTELTPGAAYNVSIYAFNYGYYEEQRGPQATLIASTANGSSVLTSIIVPVAAALAFVLMLSTLALVMVCKKSGVKKRMAASDEEQESELITITPPIRLRHRLCPRSLFDEDDTYYTGD